MSRFSYEEFDHVDHQIVARLIQDSLEQDREDPSVNIDENAPEPVRELIETLREPPGMGEPTDLQLREDLIKTMLHLRHNPGQGAV